MIELKNINRKKDSGIMKGIELEKFLPLVDRALAEAKKGMVSINENC